ncbi:predicted protein [Chaetoceros tenuissimus]|uniref:Uncharacterized protein n=1 Tax=Chaetoceros tenuissimus TaxID=426638 RepID=A0AAD3D3B7_9STRA|nr:predicted protein [Chaetoceros tenuissimus]
MSDEDDESMFSEDDEPLIGDDIWPENLRNYLETIHDIVKRDNSKDHNLEVTCRNCVDSFNVQTTDSVYSVNIEDTMPLIAIADNEEALAQEVAKPPLYAIFVNFVLENEIDWNKHQFKVIDIELDDQLNYDGNHDGLLARTVEFVDRGETVVLAIQDISKREMIFIDAIRANYITQCEEICARMNIQSSLGSNINYESEICHLKCVEKFMEIIRPNDTIDGYDAWSLVEMSFWRAVLKYASENNLIQNTENRVGAPHLSGMNRRARKGYQGTTGVDSQMAFSFHYNYGVYCQKCQEYFKCCDVKTFAFYNFVSSHLRTRHKDFLQFHLTLANKLTIEAHEQCINVAALYKKFGNSPTNAERKTYFEQESEAKGFLQNIKKKNRFYKNFIGTAKFQEEINAVASGFTLEQLLSHTLELIPQITWRPNPLLEKIQLEVENLVEIIFHPTNDSMDRQDFRNKVKKHIHNFNPEILDFAEVVAKLPVENGWGGDFEQYAKDMTTTMHDEISRFEMAMLDCVPIILKEGIRVLDETDSLGRKALASVCEHNVKENTKISFLKGTIAELLHDRGINENKDDLVDLVRTNPKLATNIALHTTSLFDKSHHKKPNLLREITKGACGQYSNIFKEYLLFLIRRQGQGTSFHLVPNWDRIKTHFRDVGDKLAEEEKNGVECYEPNIHDVRFVASFILASLNLDEKRNDLIEITEPGLFCRSRALMWTTSDLAEDSLMYRSDIFDERSPAHTHKATTALLYSFRMCVLFADRYRQDRNSDNLDFANFPHTSTVLTLAGLATLVKPYEDMLQSGLNAAEMNNHLDATPFTDSFTVRVGKEKKEITVHAAMIRRALKKTILDFKLRFRTCINELCENDSNLLHLLVFVLEENCNFKEFEAKHDGRTIIYVGSTFKYQDESMSTEQIEEKILTCLQAMDEEQKKEGIRKLVFLHNDLQICLFTILQLGGTFGHPRGSEIARICQCKFQQSTSLSWRHSDVVFVADKLANVLELVYNGNLKSSLIGKQQLLREETRRCFVLEYLIRRIILASSPNTISWAEVPYLNRFKVEDGHISADDAFATHLGFTLDPDTFTIVENHADVCLDKLEEVLGIDMQLSKWRQIRSSFASSILDFSRNLNNLQEKEEVFFKVLGQEGFSHQPFNLSSEPFTQQREPFIHLQDARLQDEYKGMYLEYRNSLGDMAFIVNSNFSEVDLYKWEENANREKKLVRILVTPSKELASLRAKCLEGVDTINVMFDFEDGNIDYDIFHERNSKQIVIILTLENLLEFDFNTLRKMDNLDIREIMYTDLPLVLARDDELCRLETVHRLNIFEQQFTPQIVVMPPLGKEIEGKVLQSVGSQVIFSTAQINRFKVLKAESTTDTQDTMDKLIQCNGKHACSNIQKLLRQNLNLYKTIDDFEIDDFVNALDARPLSQSNCELLILFLPSSRMINEVYENCNIENALLLPDTKEESIGKFVEGFSSLQFESHSRVVIMAIAHSAYIVHKIMSNDICARGDDQQQSLSSFTVAYSTHEVGIYNFLQCFCCRLNNEDSFLYVHDEEIMKVRQEQTINCRAQEVYQSNGSFTQKSMAEMICSEDPLRYLTVYVGEEDDETYFSLEDSQSDEIGTDLFASLSSHIRRIVPENNAVPIATLVATFASEDQEGKIESFLFDGRYNRWVPPYIRIQIKKQEKKKNYSAFSSFPNDLTFNLRQHFGFSMESCCFNCSLPNHSATNIRKNMRSYHINKYREYCSNQRLAKPNSTECIFDRRMCIISSAKDDFCDTCYLHKNLWPASHHEGACPGDILFIYIVMVFGDQDLYESFLVSVPNAKSETECMDYELLLQDYQESLPKWTKNLHWLVATEKNNREFWYFVSKRFSKKK